MPRKSQGDRLADDEDPVLQMWGVGKEIWAPEGGDAFIARERSDSIPQVDFESASAAPVGKPTRGLKTLKPHLTKP